MASSRSEVWENLAPSDAISTEVTFAASSSEATITETVSVEAIATSSYAAFAEFSSEAAIAEISS